MKIIISVLGFVQVVLLLVSIAFLWLTMWSYFFINGTNLPVQNGLTIMFGTGFLVSFVIFAVLFFSDLYLKWKRAERKNEGVKP